MPLLLLGFLMHGIRCHRKEADQFGKYSFFDLLISIPKTV
jgi:hypothetical protein